MQKVLEYGTWEDFVALMRHYGFERVKTEIINATYLRKDVLNFVCFFIQLTTYRFYILHAQTVEPATLELLKQLIQMPLLSQFALVGTTNLTLRLGASPIGRYRPVYRTPFR